MMPSTDGSSTGGLKDKRIWRAVIIAAVMVVCAVIGLDASEILVGV